VLRYADSRHDRIDREYEIDHCDLQDDQDNAVSVPAQRAFLTLIDIDLAVDLECGLGNEKEAAANQDDIAPGNLVTECDNERIA
jgi:hypothetical protein